MSQIQLKEKNNPTVEADHLIALYHWMLDHNDNENALKILDIFEKWNRNEFNISFAGHFSAGKSSIINALIGKDILPKSPIPTSANIVKINSDSGTVRLFLDKGEILEFHEPYDFEVIKEYSTDKSEIKRIEISTSEPIIPKGSALIDTPGIDAADDADGKLTEASLHLVDVLFYIMDYNHVQSEVNLQFLQKVQEMNIPYYVVINQIDKHNESEISFKNFETRIHQTFHHWNLKPIAYFYSSVMDPTAKHSQFLLLKETITQLMNRNLTDHVNVDISVQQVIKAHKEFLHSTYEEKANEFRIDEDTNIEEEMEEIQYKLQSIEEKIVQFEKEFIYELEHTLENAYLMPATLRDQALNFLESTDKNFKVGIFGTKKKTKAEKERRLVEFLQPLQKNIEASIQWKLREKLSKIANNYGLKDEKVQHSIESINLTYTAEDLTNKLKPGAKINGDYVINYTNDIVNDIKRQFKHKTMAIMDAIKKKLFDESNQQTAKLKEQFKHLESLNREQQQLQSLKQTYDKKFNQLNQLINHPNTDKISFEKMQAALEQKENAVRKLEQSDIFPTTKKEVPEVRMEIEEQVSTSTFSIEPVLNSIQQIVSKIDNIPAVNNIKNDLLDKRKNLKKRSYTIALFGAFSAGKSSFINALIGEAILPVSPNPTTAVVNRIRPTTENYRHNTIVISLKNEESLANDLLQITKRFSPESTKIDDLLKWIEEEGIHRHPNLNHLYQSYLEAMLKGYSHYKETSKISNRKEIDIDDFHAYVTDESKACYIEAVDLYYDCSLTKQGITLVDTPGADSINARHTNVAFDYIKHADAILYVTYFNHALSRADRDFLLQLGRVKDAFQLDKMFFIVNAADLAKDEQELQLVVKYIQEQLLQLGIRLPRLYPVSSKESLLEKQQRKTLNQQMVAFEERFYCFIHHDLTALTVESALRDIVRINQTLKHLIETLNLNESEKESRKHELNDGKAIIQQFIEEMETSLYKNRINDKIDKQIFYVLERLSVRFHDIFKDFFNPTTVTESGGKALRQLKTNMEQLLDYVSFELHQELQAVSLRLEAFIHEQEKEVYVSIQNKSKDTDYLFELSDWKLRKLETPNYHHAFEDMDVSIFNKVLATYKGTKAFFAKNEKERMKEQLFDILSPHATDYVNHCKEIMQHSYEHQWERNIERMKEHTMKQIEHLLQDYIKMTTTNISIVELEKIVEFISILLTKHGIEELTS